MSKVKDCPSCGGTGKAIEGNDLEDRIAEQDTIIKELAEALYTRTSICCAAVAWNVDARCRCPTCDDDRALIAKATKDSG